MIADPADSQLLLFALLALLVGELGLVLRVLGRVPPRHRAPAPRHGLRVVPRDQP